MSQLYAISEKPKSILQSREAPDEGVDAAQAAATKAIQSVEQAMAQVRTDAAVKQSRMAELDEQNKEVKRLLKKAEDDLNRATAELAAKKEMLSDTASKNDELFRSLRAERAAFARVKDELVAATGDLTELKRSNRELLTRQANEKSVRQELLTELEAMQLEINTLDNERADNEHVRVELEMRLRLQSEAFEKERSAHKVSQMQYLQQLQEAQQAIQFEQKRNQEANAELARIQDENKQLESQLQSQSQQLQELSREYKNIEAQLERMRDDNAKLTSEGKLQEAERRNVTVQLKTSEQQLRVMSEKVFTLMQQLQKTDDVKTRLDHEQTEAKRNIIMYQRKIETFKKENNKLSIRNNKLESTVSSLKQRLDKVVRQSNDYKRKHQQAEKSLKEVNRNLKGQRSLLKDVKAQNVKTVSQLQKEGAKRKEAARTQKQLEKKIKTLDSDARSLRHQIAHMEKDREQYVSALRRQQRRIETFKEKNELFRRLKHAVVSQESAFEELESLEQFEARVAAESTTEQQYDDDIDIDALIEKGNPKALTVARRKSRSPTKRRRIRNRARDGAAGGTGAAVATGDNRNTRAIIRRLMRTHTGKQLAEVLAKFGVREADIVSWSVSPSEFFKGLNSVISSMTEDVGRASMAQEQKEDEIDMLSEKTRDLIGRLEASEQSKTKALLRLANMMQRVSRRAMAAGGAGRSGYDEGDTFLTQVETKDGDRMAGGGRGGGADDDDDDDDVDMSKLDLSANGVEDHEMEFLAEALKNNGQIQRVDLSRNMIRGNGLMQVVVAVMSQKSACMHLDLRWNKITLSGLEVLINFIHSSSGVGGIVMSRLSEERGSGKKIIPHLVLQTQSKTLSIDMRHNPIFRFRTPVQDKVETYRRLSAILHACSIDEDAVPNIPIPRDVETRDDMDEQPAPASTAHSSSFIDARQDIARGNLLGTAARHANKESHSGAAQYASSGSLERKTHSPGQRRSSHATSGGGGARKRGSGAASSQARYMTYNGSADLFMDEPSSASSTSSRRRWGMQSRSRHTASMPALPSRKGSRSRSRRTSKGARRGKAATTTKKKRSALSAADRAYASQMKLPSVKNAWH